MKIISNKVIIINGCKKCSKCNVFFSKSDFHKDITKNDGFRSSCKRRTNQYYYDNQNRLLDNHKTYIKNNRSKINAYEKDKKNPILISNYIVV